ncbi:MAG: VCBS repeat-containing protein [Acidimicrobiia bacterium]
MRTRRYVIGLTALAMTVASLGAAAGAEEPATDDTPPSLEAPGTGAPATDPPSAPPEPVAPPTTASPSTEPTEPAPPVSPPPSTPAPASQELPDTLEVPEPGPLTASGSDDQQLGTSATASLSSPQKIGATYSQFHIKGTHESFSTAAVGDISGDGQPDIVSGGMDGHLRAYHKNGTKFMDVVTGGGAVQASPALVDLSNDGVLDVLVANAGGAVAVYKGNSQRIFWRPDNWFFKVNGFFGTPTTADLDNDGQLEIIATSYDHHVYAWNLNETLVPGFPRFVYDTIWSSPVAADIDNDGRPEIIFGGDMDFYAGAPYPWGGLLWVLEHNGVPKAGFPKSLPGQVIWSSPAVVDITGNGNLDIVVGTGLNWPNPWGRKLYAFDKKGNNLPGWPQQIYNGRVMASPAVGDLMGDSKPEIAVLADDGRVNVYNSTGTLKWSRCAADSGTGCPQNKGTHGQPAIADVDNDGQQEVVVQAEHWMRIFDGASGNEETQASWPLAWAPASSPAITEIDGVTHIIQTATSNTKSGPPGVGDTAGIYIWETGTPLGQADWPTFKKNSARTGTYLDDVAPVASVDATAANQTATPFTMSFTATDADTGVKKFIVDSRDASGTWVPWLNKSPDSVVGDTARLSRSFYGIPGETYDFRVRAQDGAGNISPFSAVVSTTVNGGATDNRPFNGMYALSRRGRVASQSSPPADGPNWPWNIARGIAATPDGAGGYVVDGFGGLHKFGTAPSITSSGYWSGWDIVRGVALNPDGTSGYKLDAFGGLHRIGNAAPVTNADYWPGWHLAADIAMLPTSTAADPAGYVLDIWGGMHEFGSAPPVTGKNWIGWNIARGLALDPEGPGGYILDGFGGVHPFGGAAPSTSNPYWHGWDIARDIALIADGNAGQPTGYVLDGFGGVHRVSGAPTVSNDEYFGWNTAKYLTVAP